MRTNIEEGNEYFPSNFTPDLVMDVVEEYINTLPYRSTDICLFNYPSADMRN